MVLKWTIHDCYTDKTLSNSFLSMSLLAAKGSRKKKNVEVFVPRSSNTTCDEHCAKDLNIISVIFFLFHAALLGLWPRPNAKYGTVTVNSVAVPYICRYEEMDSNAEM